MGWDGAVIAADVAVDSSSVESSIKRNATLVIFFGRNSKPVVSSFLLVLAVTRDGSTLSTQSVAGHIQSDTQQPGTEQILSRGRIDIAI